MPTRTESLIRFVGVPGSLAAGSALAFLARTYLGQWELLVFIASILLADGGLTAIGQR